jgi:hypothetical protein
MALSYHSTTAEYSLLVNSEVEGQNRGSLYEMYVEQVGPGVGFSQSASVSTCQLSLNYRATRIQAW